jgi:hypothetical protein
MSPLTEVNMSWKQPHVVLAAIALAAVLGSWACDREKGPGAGTPSEVAQFPDSLACPDHDSFLAWRGDTSGSFTQVTLAGSTTLIPEFHDCQRLIDDKHSFGPLVGIWVPEYLPTVMDSLPDSQTAIAVAVVHSWDGTYKELDIAQKWNCLYLFRKPGSGNELRAKMIPVGSQSDCDGRRPTSDLPPPYLDVTPIVTAGMGPEDYPAVGRWDRDRHQPKHFIGLTCGAAWCEISKGKHGSSRQYSLKTVTAPKKRRVFEVKGWYDEQYLAVPAASGGLEPLSFLGTLVPDPDLQDRDLHAFEGIWVPAGTASLEAESAEYRAKLYISPGSLPNGYDAGANLTKVSLCQESGGMKCVFMPASEKPTCGGTTGQWYARIEEVGSVVRYHYKCVTRHDHSGLGRTIPGTARWSWQENDETQWWRCSEGCCTVKP